jgi:glucose 1-dehydrogenase
MKAIVVNPGKPNTAHLRDVDPPTLDSIPDGRGALVKILRVGLDGTDHEINAGEYGATPPGADFLILGHEGLGVVQEVGPNVREVSPGDHVVAIVRQPGSSIYDQLGMADMTTDETYHEHGISLVHGFLTEFYVEAADRLIHIPDSLGKLGVLLEPTSIIEKGIAQANELQRRLRVWQPKRAAVLGAGTVGLLATMGLRLRGIEVITLGLDEPPYLNSDLIEALGATYLSTKQTSLAQAAQASGPLDLIYECTGFSPLVFEAMQALGKNGVLVLASVTGGTRKVEVLGNKAMVGTVNANKEHFEAGVRDLTMAQALWPGWIERLLTHCVDGLNDWPKAFELLGHSGVIKVFVEVAEA